MMEFCCCFRTSYEWVNPAQFGLVVVTCSEGRNLPYGRLEDILSRDSSALNCHTNDDKYVFVHNVAVISAIFIKFSFFMSQ